MPKTGSAAQGHSSLRAQQEGSCKGHKRILTSSRSWSPPHSLTLVTTQPFKNCSPPPCVCVVGVSMFAIAVRQRVQVQQGKASVKALK